MVITYYGTQFFKIQLGDLTIAYNPVAKNSKHNTAKFGADIALASMNHPDFNGITQVAYGEKEPFIAVGPGEYEVGGTVIRGYGTDTTYEKKHLINTVYSLSLEGMNLCFLGALPSADALSPKTREALDGIDMLFVPIGGGDVLNPDEAHKLSTKLEARVVVPMHMEGGTKDALKLFLKEAGEEAVKPAEKLTIKRRDLDAGQGGIVVLKSLA